MFEPDSLSAGVYDRELRVSLASRGYRQERTCSLPEPAFLLPSKYQCPNNRLSLGMEVLEAASNAAWSPTGTVRQMSIAGRIAIYVCMRSLLAT